MKTCDRDLLRMVSIRSLLCAAVLSHASVVPKGAETATTGLNSASEAMRVFRGGSWEGGPHRCRSVARQCVWAQYRAGMIGFRVALAPPVSREEQTTNHPSFSL